MATTRFHLWSDLALQLRDVDNRWLCGCVARLANIANHLARLARTQRCCRTFMGVVVLCAAFVASIRFRSRCCDVAYPAACCHRVSRVTTSWACASAVSNLGCDRDLARLQLRRTQLAAPAARNPRTLNYLNALTNNQKYAFSRDAAPIF